MRPSSSWVSSISLAWAFAAIRSGERDLGIAHTPRCSSQASTTWAGVRPWASAISRSTSSSVTRPRASGE
jgi:hypothetical protein